MKKSLIYGLVCLILSLGSCQKDEVLPEGNELAKTSVAPNICATQEKMAENLLDPEFRKAHEARLAAIEKFEGRARAICDNPVLIPVAIHYQNIANPDVECLRALAQNQIDLINADFQGSNSDLFLWEAAAATFPGVTPGETCVRFYLADKNHPAGFGLVDGDPAVTINQTSGDRDSDWANYVNVFVRNLSAGLLGYVQSIPGAGNGDGATISRNAFGSGTGCDGVRPNTPYHLGRTLTHEMGHFLNLRHIWGDGPCNATDFVDDTPSASDNNSGCPNLGKSSCGTPDLHMNYMDYTYQACMYMFTAGQASRMETALIGAFPNILSNAYNVCSIAPNPTCSDGIVNGDETGIDCGGSCVPCSSTCNNGQKDGDETGVDCGGSCPDVCADPPSSTNGCMIVANRYASFATENSVEIREIAKIIATNDDPQVKSILRKLVKHQDEVISVLGEMNENARAKSLMSDLIKEYMLEDKDNLRMTTQSSDNLIAYLELAKTYIDSNSELNALINEAIEVLN
ncbi:MAG: M43 family zinc metalloprotease [Chitinophagales bacterium]